ncbi:hypothetical protein B0A49_09650 [Cryomyces minteri]|uniref:Early meiotic induction protein 1 n=1 Tax=Cryomyces minteri TaxID=331657 RepID=A0A4U0WEV7_9PEZI|nr:hypothetical protein B0A49_09650 [Cryomyces minteri]
MGWFWSASTVPTPKPLEPLEPLKEVDDHPPHAPEPSQSPPNPEDAPVSQPLKPLSRDAQADADLQSLIASFSSEAASHARTRASRTDGSDLPPAPAHSHESARPDTGPAAAGDISPDSLFPSEMSCRQAFDSAFYCQSLGGQFNQIYRFGELRGCSEHWSNFWFCMRTKSQPEEKKASMIREHYRQRHVKYKVGPSSEDVWQLRTEPVQDAFNKDPDLLTDEALGIVRDDSAR